MQPLKVIISGGGTGGHIFPAIAIADAIKALRPNAEILFIGALNRMEMERVPKAGYRIEGLWISGLQRKLSLKNLSFPFKVISSIIKARRIVKKFKPHVAVGVGGYASGPLLRAAASMGVPSVIQEQNSFPGITNRILASKARIICVAYPEMERWFAANKIVLTGNPVRKQLLLSLNSKNEAAEYFGLNPSIPTILIVGGSLGARTINEVVASQLGNIAAMGVQLIWQTGKFFAPQASELLAQHQNARLFTSAFIDRMDLAYALADAVVSRAGAMSVSELCLVAKPSILVPSPNVAEDHQTKNAMALVKRNAAMIVKDHEAQTALLPALQELMGNSGLRSELAKNIGALALPNADRDIAQLVINLADKT